MSQHLKPTQSHPAVTSQGRTFHLRVGRAVIWAHTSGNLGCCRGGTGRGLRGAGRPRPTVFSCPWFLLRRTQCWCPGGRPPRVPAGYPLRHQVASGRSQAGGQFAGPVPGCVGPVPFYASRTYAPTIRDGVEIGTGFREHGLKWWSCSSQRS